jgi:pyruvyltransferase
MTPDRTLRTIRLFWPRRPHPGNFGDLLGPLIMQHYGYQVEHAKQDNAQVFHCGSVAKLAGPGTVVLGSGVISSYNDVNPGAHWIWTRGPMTRARVLACGGQCPEIYGDPALLMPRIVRPSAKKHFDVGIVPHYVDHADVERRYPDHRVINVLNSMAARVVLAITECERIISSSLHGIIVAHAYGIPAAWVEFSDRLAGDGIKFRDYFASVGLPDARPSTVEDPVYYQPDIDAREIDYILTRGDWLDLLDRDHG